MIRMTVKNTGVDLIAEFNEENVRMVARNEQANIMNINLLDKTACLLAQDGNKIHLEEVK